jgi:hypothetical protein
MCLEVMIYSELNQLCQATESNETKTYIVNREEEVTSSF